MAMYESDAERLALDNAAKQARIEQGLTQPTTSEAARQALLRAMYFDDEDEGGEGTSDSKPLRGDLPSTNRRARRVVMGAVSYDVPTVEYVESVERQLQQAQRTIEEQGRAIRRLESALSNVQHITRRQAASVNELARDLDGKIDRRD